jgi:hypothetical protein
MLSEYLKDLLEDKDKRIRLGRDANLTAKEIFQWNTTATRIQDILKDPLSEDEP